VNETDVVITAWTTVPFGKFMRLRRRPIGARAARAWQTTLARGSIPKGVRALLSACLIGSGSPP
jgi:hypothetical protein